MGKRILQGSLTAFGILLLIIDTRTALEGAQKSIDLCLKSVIPSIFPFLVLSGVLTPALCGMHFRVLRPFGRILGIPGGAESLFLTGILGGYPTGAQAVYQAWQRGQISKEDARRMLAFCSNAGPSFIFGILAAKFPEQWMLWLLWGIHILSAIIVAMILPGKQNNDCTISPVPPVTLTHSVRNAVMTMATICGWILFFRIILAFLDRWVLWLLPIDMRVTIYGILELANGCCSLELVASTGTRFVLASGILALGGVCVAMQTESVTGELGMGMYLPGKLLQTVVSVLLSMVIQFTLFPASQKVAIYTLFLILCGIFLLFLTILFRKKQNRGSIPAAIGV